MIIRIFASVSLLISVLFFPFWISVILGLVFMAYFSFFLETVFLFLLSDLLYGAPVAKFFNIEGVSFIGALACFLLIEIIKNKLRFRT